MLRIGDKTVIHASTFILPADEEAYLEFNNEGVQGSFRVKFLEDSSNKDNLSLSIEPDPDAEGRGLLTLTNWKRPTRVSTPDPISIMEFDDFDLWFLASSMHSDSKYCVTLQFMKGDKE